MHVWLTWGQGIKAHMDNLQGAKGIGGLTYLEREGGVLCTLSLPLSCYAYWLQDLKKSQKTSHSSLLTRSHFSFLSFKPEHSRKGLGQVCTPEGR